MSVPLEPALIPDNLLISRGIMTTTPYTATPTAVASTHTVTVTNSASVMDDSQQSTDVRVMAVYNETQDKWFGELTTQVRSGISGILVTPPGWFSTGDILDVYTGYVAAPGSPNSNTSSASVVAQCTAT
jgi:hypothetical protein